MDTQERLAAAQAEYQRGLANLKATSSQLSSLSKSVSGTEKSARSEWGTQEGKGEAWLASGCREFMH